MNITQRRYRQAQPIYSQTSTAPGAVNPCFAQRGARHAVAGTPAVVYPVGVRNCGQRVARPPHEPTAKQAGTNWNTQRRRADHGGEEHVGCHRPPHTVLRVVGAVQAFD